MLLYADGSDHRSCCAQWGVPRRCLDWCRGEPLLNNKFCVLSYTKQIMSCFHEGRGNVITHETTVTNNDIYESPSFCVK